ncbi:hypothetical protein [Pelosinus sp. sgz500959]|uniref:hypothetical protein n=1 Tax=Pelosinus sp. sgz500959 TaxID=3242472 RepID=UPI00367068B2
MTIADKLVCITNTKKAIKDAIVAKGVAVPDGTVFSDYPAKIGNISVGGASNIPKLVMSSKVETGQEINGGQNNIIINPPLISVGSSVTAI